jgi:hypothetical protein
MSQLIRVNLPPLAPFPEVAVLAAVSFTLVDIANPNLVFGTCCSHQAMRKYSQHDISLFDISFL